MFGSDICFCGNKDCKKRKSCMRALENHNKESIPQLISMANFKCFNEGENIYYIKKKRGR